MEPMVHVDDRDDFSSRLKKALEIAGQDGYGVGARVAKKLKVTPKAVSKWMNGETQPGHAKRMELARWLGVREEWLDYGRGPMEIGKSSEPLSTGGDATENGGTSPHERDYAIIPQLSARGQGGEGYLNEHVEVTGGLAFKRAWLAKMHVRPDDLSIIYAEGDSMEPWITQGDVVLIDHASIDPVSGQVFALRRPDGGVSIKRLVQQFSGQWRLSSDSSDKARHPNEDVDASSVSQVPIIGRVVWRGGAMI